MQPMRVLTLNLWGRQGEWSARREVVRDGLRELRPDILAFQESIVTPHYDQVKDLLSREYEVIHQNGRSPDGTGNSIATRFPLGEVRERFLHVTPRVDSGHSWIGSVAAIDVTAPKPIGKVLLVHVKPSWQPGYERERELQSAAAAAFIHEVLGDEGLPVVLMGDFDAAPDTSSVKSWKSRSGPNLHYVDAWEAAHPGEEGHTFTPRNPLVPAGGWTEEEGRRIDYVLVKGLDVVNCSLVFDKPERGVWASDHFGVVADLKREP